MRTMKILFAVLVCMSAAATVSAQETDGKETIVLGKEIMPKDTTVQRRFKNHLIAPKGEWQCGLSVMYADFSRMFIVLSPLFGALPQTPQENFLKEVFLTFKNL